jgi:hypothetical protein
MKYCLINFSNLSWIRQRKTTCRRLRICVRIWIRNKSCYKTSVSSRRRKRDTSKLLSKSQRNTCRACTTQPNTPHFKTPLFSPHKLFDLIFSVHKLLIFTLRSYLYSSSYCLFNCYNFFCECY